MLQGDIIVSQQGAYQKGKLVPDPCSWSPQATGLWRQHSLARRRKSPTDSGAVVSGLGAQKETELPAGQEVREDVIAEEVSEGER